MSFHSNNGPQKLQDIYFKMIVIIPKCPFDWENIKESLKIHIKYFPIHHTKGMGELLANTFISIYVLLYLLEGGRGPLLTPNVFIQLICSFNNLITLAVTMFNLVN